MVPLHIGLNFLKPEIFVNTVLGPELAFVGVKRAQADKIVTGQKFHQIHLNSIGAKNEIRVSDDFYCFF